MSLFTTLIGTVISTVKMVKDKAKFTEIAMELVTKLPGIIMDMISFNKIDNAEKLDEALAEVDLRTGIDDGAIDIVKDLPADKEEALFDHLKGMIEILGKNKLKVEGYYLEE